MYTDDLTRITPKTTVSTTETHKWGVCPSDSQYTASMVVNDSWSQSWKYGEKIPDFHKRRAKGELLPFTNFYKGTNQGAILKKSGTVKAKNTQYNICSQSSNLCPAWSLQSFDDLWNAFEPSLWNWEAYVQAAAAAIDSKSFDLLTFAAELRELRKLWELISGRYFKKQLAKMADRKTLNKRNQDISDTFVDTWLGARYGIRPLIKDIENLNKALKDNLGELRRFKERVGVSSSWDTSTNLGNIAVGWGHPYTVPMTRTVQFSTSIRGSVIADIDVNTFKIAPLQTGWELLPYSFVVDWFLSVGRALGATSFLLFNKGYYAAKGLTVTFRQTVESGTSMTNTDGGKTIWLSPPNLPLILWDEWVVEKRVPTSVSLTPFAQVRLDPWKALDLYALLDQLARKLR